VLAAQVKAGNLRLLASTAEKPEALLPQVPVIQQTLPGFVVDSWYGFVAQPTLPPAEIASISEAVRAAVTDPAMRDRLQAMYIDPSFEDPAAFARTMASTRESWRRVTTELGIVPQ
jgi:tripartite-type tricarboxylate transporter receptor subunit TctC